MILPHTIAGHEDLLSKFGSNVTIICRESVSLDHCRRVARGAQVLAAHDMAFSVDPSRLPWPASAKPPRPIKARYADYRSKHIAFLATTGLNRELSVFRNDAERDPQNISPPGNDISKLFQPPQHRLVEMMMAAHFFLATISTFDVIRTDRLHVAIAGALLGKRVELHANSYFKNRAVYDFSLKSLPNVRFVNRAA